MKRPFARLLKQLPEKWDRVSPGAATSRSVNYSVQHESDSIPPKGIFTPSAASISVRDRRELSERLAGVGYSEVGMRTTSEGARINSISRDVASPKVVVANSCQLVSLRDAKR